MLGNSGIRSLLVSLVLENSHQLSAFSRQQENSVIPTGAQRSKRSGGTLCSWYLSPAISGKRLEMNLQLREFLDDQQLPGWFR
jgi:hypothetical protein